MLGRKQGSSFSVSIPSRSLSLVVSQCCHIFFITLTLLSPLNLKSTLIGRVKWTVLCEVPSESSTWQPCDILLLICLGCFSLFLLRRLPFPPPLLPASASIKTLVSALANLDSKNNEINRNNYAHATLDISLFLSFFFLFFFFSPHQFASLPRRSFPGFCLYRIQKCWIISSFNFFFLLKLIIFQTTKNKIEKKSIFF